MKNVYILSCVLFISSCQTVKSNRWTSQDIIISDKVSLTFPKSVTTSQAKEDIDFLIFLLSKAYSGKDHLPGNTFSEAIHALRKISGDTNLEQFHEQIDEALFIIPDNHLLSYYKGQDGKKRISMEKIGNVGKNNIKDPKRVWEVRNDSIANKKILYISLTRFPNPDSELWNGFLESVSSQLKNSESIVLDMRGNGGGYDNMGMRLTTLLFGHPYEHPIKRQIRFQSLESLALELNRNKLSMINLSASNEKIPTYLVDEFNRAEREYKRAQSGQIAEMFILTGKGGGSRSEPVTGFKKPIYILMDAECGSSCEFVVSGFQWHDYVKTVGENTNGTFHFSNTGLAILPNSKIRVNIPSQYSEYFDQRFIERVGFTPDIKVSGGEDAYEAVKKIISTN